jgi:hypothetical protein
MPRLRYNSKHIKFGTKRATYPITADVTVTVNRAASPVRAASDRYLIGITFTHETFVGSNSTSRANAIALMQDLNLDVVNMHSHGFGQDGPKINADHAAGRTYADRASWTGWSAWDARMDFMRDCGGTNTEYMIALLPPGWCRMDGGSKTNAASDPMAAGRTWDNLQFQHDVRHTDAHRTDMIDMAKAIALRHADVKYFTFINEQKGNWMPPDFPSEIVSDGISQNYNWKEQERYQEGLRTALDAIGKTDIELIGPYLVVQGGHHEVLATTYAGIGFPQAAATASIPSNTFAIHFPQTKAAIAARTRTFLENWFSLTASSSRDNWYGLDWKVFDGDDDQDNWDVLFPWRWYMFEGLRAQIQQVKTVTGYTSSDRMCACETYWRKVQDFTNIPSDDEQGAMAAELLRIELEEGVKMHLRWAPEQGEDAGVAKPNQCNLFTCTKFSPANGGGVAFPAYDTYKLYCDHFRGVDVYTADSSDEHVVTAVANSTETLLINHTGASKTVSINGASAVTLTAYEVLVVTA